MDEYVKNIKKIVKEKGLLEIPSSPLNKTIRGKNIEIYNNRRLKKSLIIDKRLLK